LQNREILCAVVWVLRHRQAWNNLPPQYCSPGAAWRRFHEWTQAGLWRKLVRGDLAMHPLLAGVCWECTPGQGWMPVLARRVRIKK
jgi:transposase